jgi:NhaP-type Na+/H+ or K+/H+ antiporter
MFLFDRSLATSRHTEGAFAAPSPVCTPHTQQPTCRWSKSPKCTPMLQVLRPESHPALYSIVLGEGVLNDATSVALLRSVKPSGSDAALTPSMLLSMMTFFLYVFGASLALGATSGLAIAAAMKHLGPFSQPQEVALVGALAFLSYLVAEVLGLSGILALFFCGMFVSHYALQHVSSQSRAALLNAFATLSYLLEGLIFLYVGRDALDPVKWSNASFFTTLYLVVVIAALVAVSRACFVFPCGPSCWLLECV